MGHVSFSFFRKMAGFIDIACNFTHESFQDNLDSVIANAENVGVEKFVLL